MRTWPCRWSWPLSWRIWDCWARIPSSRGRWRPSRRPSAGPNSSQATDATCSESCKSLPRDMLQRFQDLRQRCLELRQIATDLKQPGERVVDETLEQSQLAGLDRLLWIFLRLLYTHFALSRFLAEDRSGDDRAGHRQDRRAAGQSAGRFPESATAADPQDAGGQPAPPTRNGWRITRRPPTTCSWSNCSWTSWKTASSPSAKWPSTARSPISSAARSTGGHEHGPDRSDDERTAVRHGPGRHQRRDPVLLRPVQAQIVE